MAGDKGGVDDDPGVLGVDNERDLPVIEDGDEGEKEVGEEDDP